MSDKVKPETVNPTPKPFYLSSELWISIATIIVVVAIWYAGGVFVDHNAESALKYLQKPDSTFLTSKDGVITQWQLRGVFGDKFGAINSLFSALAFAGIIFALILQRRDLNLQRKSIDEQNRSSSIQNFENSFFALLSTYSTIVDQLRTNKGSNGREVFLEFLLSMKKKSEELAVFSALRKLTKDEVFGVNSSGAIPDGIKSKLLKEDISNIEESIASRNGVIDKFIKADQALHITYIESAYNLAHFETGGALSHYFRNLYVMLRFIDESAHVDSQRKSTYIRIVRAQLSENELLCLAYNCISKPDGKHADHLFGNPKMSILCKKYNILKNLNKSVLFHEEHVKVLESVGAI